MLNIKLINLHTMMFTTILLVISFASTLSKMIILEAFIEYKNLVLGILGLVIVNYVTIDNAKIIWTSE